MADRLTPGKLYKIWDVKNEFYVTAGRGRSTWTSLKWVTSKLLDLSKWSRNNFSPNDYEVHEFQVTFDQTISAADLIHEENSRRNKKGAAEKRMKELRPLIMQHLPGVGDFGAALRVYESGLMKESVVESVRPLVTEYKECKRIVG